MYTSYFENAWLSNAKYFYAWKNIEKCLKRTYQTWTKAEKSRENPKLWGNLGGSSCKTLLSTSKSVLQSWYGNLPVASSTLNWKH